MALISLTDLDGSGKPAARKIVHLTRLTVVYLQVQGAATIRISDNQQDLFQPGPGGLLQGLQLNSMTMGGVVLLWWVGDLWAIANGPAAVELIIMGETHPMGR